MSILDTYARQAREERDRPMRDSGGRFVKGHKPIRRPKYELMQKNPRLLCMTCYRRGTCPDYHKRYVCAHRREFRRFLFNRDIEPF